MYPADDQVKLCANLQLDRWVSDNALTNHHKQPHCMKADKAIADEDLLMEPEDDRFLTFSGGWMTR
jgi:hypothetical protein